MMPRRAVSDHALFPVAQALLVMHLFDGFPSQTVRPVVTDAATVTEVVLAGMLYCSLRRIQGQGYVVRVSVILDTRLPLLYWRMCNENSSEEITREGSLCQE